MSIIERAPTAPIKIEWDGARPEPVDRLLECTSFGVYVATPAHEHSARIMAILIGLAEHESLAGWELVTELRDDGERAWLERGSWVVYVTDESIHCVDGAAFYADVHGAVTRTQASAAEAALLRHMTKPTLS